MRVLIKRSKNQSVNHIFDGMARVMVATGVSNPVSWDEKLKPSYDAFDELNPDIILVSTYDLSMPDIKCLAEYRQTIFVLHDAYGHRGVDYAALNVKPDLLFSSARKQLSGLECLACAVDTLNIHPVNQNTLLSISAIIEQTEKMGYILPYCSPDKNPNLAVFSETDLGIPQYFGNHVGNEPSIYARSAMNIVFGSRQESNHRLYDCIKYGGLPVQEYNETDQDILGSSVPMFQKQDNITKWIEYFAKYPGERQKTIELLAKKCAGHNTYFHRAYRLFDLLGMTEEASKIENFK